MKSKKLLLILFIIMLFSLINNYNARFMLSTYDNYFIKQLIWYLAGFLGIFILSKINVNFFIKQGLYFYLFGNLLLLITLFFGSNINGSRSWLNLGFFSLQPSEFMKIFLIIYLRNISLKTNLKDSKYILLTGLIVLIPSILTFLEPDTGAVLMYIVTYIIFLMLRKIKVRWYLASLGIFIIGGLIFGCLYFYQQTTFINIFGTSFFYRMDRIVNFFSQEGYQIKKALTSIGASGLLGIKDKVYFPEAPTDFAFTLLISNIGYIGIIIFLIVYFLFIREIFYLKKDKYLKYSLGYLLLIQYTINIFMNIGLVPIIGITLPLISYGGSSMLSYMLLIGLLVNSNNQRYGI